MPTVIQNGCTYRIVKTYHCGCEYEYCTPPSYEPFIDLLIVGGGGGGGSVMNGTPSNAGGGGGGGYIYCEAYPLDKECSSYSLCVGGGGAASTKGGDSCFNDIVAYGGGKGKDAVCTSGNSNGGSGGGGGYSNYSSYSDCDYYGGNGTALQGNNGGNGVKCQGKYTGGGGGGGAATAGCSGSGCTGGNGGDGCLNSISGEAVYYSGGGGGSGNCSCPAATGGCGGGDASKYVNGSWECATTPTCYGGGGGANSRNNGGSGAAGQQGVVILRYKTDGTCGIKPTSTGGCKYECGERTIHCFCNAGALETFNPVYN